MGAWGDLNMHRLPLSKRGRKYGYITWRKKDDAKVLGLLGKRKYVDLVIGSEMQKRKRVDVENRRISIRYSLTRSLPKNISVIGLRLLPNGLIEISFS